MSSKRPPLSDLGTVSRQEWRNDAACAGRDPRTWDDDGDQDATDYAIAVCVKVCTVRGLCLDDALGRDEKGTVRGGYTAKQRAALSREAS